MKKNSAAMFLVLAATLVGCGDGSSSSSGYSGPSGFSSDQKDKYNNLSPEGKKYVDEQMKKYDSSR